MPPNGATFIQKTPVDFKGGRKKALITIPFYLGVVKRVTFILFLNIQA